MNAIILISYENYRGGVNNLQVAKVLVSYKRILSDECRYEPVMTFTSVVDKAESYARRWCKKFGHTII